MSDPADTAEFKAEIEELLSGCTQEELQAHPVHAATAI